jgi:hypothetical protein
VRLANHGKNQRHVTMQEASREQRAGSLASYHGPPPAALHGSRDIDTPQSSRSRCGGARTSGLLSYWAEVRPSLLHVLFLLPRHPLLSGGPQLQPRGHRSGSASRPSEEARRGAAPWQPPPPGSKESTRLGETDGGSDEFGRRGASASHTGSISWGGRRLQYAGSRRLRLGERDEPVDW